jgi:microcystin-dependent protein
MAPTQTTRLGVYRWSSGTDEFNRDQMDQSHQLLEERVALFLSGTFAARPAAGSTNAKGFYLATDQNILYYSDGSNWYSVNSFSSPVAIVPGDSNTAGTSTFAARADHKHQLPEWGAVGELAQIGTSAAAGTTAKFARVDHRHTLGAGSVVAGVIAVGGISAANQFANSVVTTSAIADGQITKAKIATDQQTPSGAILAFGGTSAPTGWLFCDGTAVSRSTYADLFSAIGTRYGTGDGATTFNLPNLVDRIPRGATSTGAAVVTAGSDTASLEVANLPGHTHPSGTLTMSPHDGHTHSVSGSANNTDINHSHYMVHNHGAVVANGKTVSNIGPAGLVITLTGASDTHQLMPPYWGGRPTDSGVQYTHMFLENGAVSVDNGYRSYTDGMSGNNPHGHSLSGTANTNGSHSHTLSGSAGSIGSGTSFNVAPKSQTVNYIIKI